MSMDIALIYARAANGVIGKDGTMPWHLPEDLAHFKQLTLGAPVIRQENWSQTGTQRSFSLHEALQIAEQSNPATVWVIGGAQIYAQALPLAQRVEVTEIAQDFAGDAHAPELGPEWLDNHWFRFGASSLANDILMQLVKEATGRYQSADYFSVD